MPTRSFAIEDGNTASSSIITTRTRVYKDIDLTFTPRPAGDIFKKTDAAAVKQAVKNLLLTNRTERPFQPNFGADLNDILFNLDTELSDDILPDLIYQAIETFERRARVLDITTKVVPERNDVFVSITFQVVNSGEVVDLELSLNRLR
jgi:phage baseplate assembly protein W